MLSTAIDIVREAGALALDHQDRVHGQDKPDGTWVTEADQAAEALIREALHARFPETLLCGEELGVVDSLGAGDIWLIDPIDGTNNYVNHLPIWAVSLGLLRDGVPELGVVYLPAIDELFTAQSGHGAFRNGRPVQPDRRGILDNHTLIAANSYAVHLAAKAAPAKPRNLGSMAAHACYVASGGVSAAVFCRWHVWDIAAGLAVAFEAGVEARYLDGSPFESFADQDPSQIGPPILIGPGWILDPLTKAVASECSVD